MIKFFPNFSSKFQKGQSIKRTAKIDSNMKRSAFFKNLTKSRNIPNYTLIDFLLKSGV